MYLKHKLIVVGPHISIG